MIAAQAIAASFTAAAGILCGGLAIMAAWEGCTDNFRTGRPYKAFAMAIVFAWGASVLLGIVYREAFG